MSKLDDILKEYRGTCFLAKDNNLNDRAVDLVAMQQVSTKEQLRHLMLEVISKANTIDLRSEKELKKLVEAL